MDPNKCDTSLGTPSLQHGCSTGVHEGEWIKVTRKSGGDKNTKDDKEKNKTYAEALLKSKASKDNSESSKMGCPPATEIKKDKNPFGPLRQEGQDGEQVDDDTGDDVQDKRSVTSHTMEPPKKKKKVNMTTDEDNFHNVCDEYAQMPASVYAYSVRDTQDDKSIELLRCDESINTSDNGRESTEEEHPDDYYKINEWTMHNIRCADDIYMFNHMDTNKKSFLYDERIHYSIQLNKKQIRKEFENMVKGNNRRKLKQWINKARSLTKIYDMAYPSILTQLFNPPRGFKFQYKN